MAAVSVIPIVLDYFEDDIVRAEILPKTRTVYEQVSISPTLYKQIFWAKEFLEAFLWLQLIAIWICCS